MLSQNFLEFYGNIMAFLNHLEINMETTFHAFKSNVRAFLSSLLKDPINTKPNKFLKDRGMSKQKLINILLKRDVIRRHEKIDDKDKENNNINYVVKYNVVRKDFERKLKRIYNKYFEKNEEKELDEATACGAASGAFVAPLSGVIRKEISESNTEKKGKKIYITEKQFEELKESLATFNAGNYQYTAPISVKKNDPSMIHRKKGGIMMDRIK